MFWKYGGYARVSPLVTLLDKPDVTVEDVLNESDLMQELKQHNTRLLEYLRDDEVLRKMYDIIVSPSLMDNEFDDNDDEEAKHVEEEDRKDQKDKDTLESSEKNETGDSDIAQVSPTAGLSPEEIEAAEKDRLTYAYVASEVLSSPIWSLIEAMVENEEALRSFWGYLWKKEPLDSLQTSYFVKVNEALLDQKPNAMLSFVMSLEGVIPAMLQHIDNPLVMDLLLKIITMEKIDGDRNVTEWLQSEGLVTKFLSFITTNYPPSSQTAAGDFLKALVTISANSAQSEQPCIGPNSLSRELVSGPCIRTLISAMVQGGNPLTVGVSLIIDIIRKNNPDYDPEMAQCRNSMPTVHDPVYLGTMLKEFADSIPRFMELLKSKSEAGAKLPTAWGTIIEPLGFDRFKTCELMAELLHCSNMGLHNEPGSHPEMVARDNERERFRREGLNKQEDDSGFVHADAVHDLAEENSVFTDFASSAGAPNANISSIGEHEVNEDMNSSGVLVEKAKDPLEVSANGDANSGVGIFTNVPKFGAGDDFVDEPLTPPDESTAPKPEKTEPDGDKTSQSQDIEATTTEPSSVSKTKDSISGTVKVPSSDLESFNQEAAFSESIPKSEQSEKPAEGPPETSASTTPTGENKEVAGEIPKVGEQLSELASGQIQKDSDGEPVIGDYVKMVLLEHKVVPTILSFFFRFRWNNFLHNVVYDIVQQLLNGPTDQGFNKTLVNNLFETAEITTQIIEAQKYSEESEATTKMRPGNMGHLTLIAEEVVKFSEREPQEVLTPGAMEKLTHPDWFHYVEHALSNIRERENAILGGVKPDVTMSHRQAVLNAISAAPTTSGSSSALANAGLNGDFPSSGLDLNFGNQASVSGGAFGFGNSGTSLFSGFGSSSDDEDEEMEDLQRGSKDVSNSAFAEGPPDSQNIPILAPPQSSLNVKPSRARRQLAARLALQKQQANEEAASSGSSNTADVADGTEFPTSPPSFMSNFDRTSGYLSSSSSDDDNNVVESVERKFRLPVDAFDDDDMGDMFEPSSSYSDDEDETAIREALGYSSFFSPDGQSGNAQTTEPSADNQDNSDEDDGIVEILVPEKKPTSS